MEFFHGSFYGLPSSSEQVMDRYALKFALGYGYFFIEAHAFGRPEAEAIGQELAEKLDAIFIEVQ
jgi:hypothetical protein